MDQLRPPVSQHFANVCDRMRGNKVAASPYTFTGAASILIFPHDTASSGSAPLSLQSNGWAVLTKTA